MKVLLQGYIGHKNFGDDLLLELALDNINKIEDVEVYCIVHDSLDVSYLNKTHPKLQVITYHSSIPLMIFSKFDKVYFIGGGVFFDYKEFFPLRVYLKKRLSNFIRFNLSKLFGTRFAGMGLGIGPFSTNKSQVIYASLLRKFDFVGLRDYKSFEYAESFGVKDATLANDSSLLLWKRLQALQKTSEDKYVVISPRTYKHVTKYEKHLEELIKFTDYLIANEYKVEWCFLQPESHLLLDKLDAKGIVYITWNPTEMGILDFVAHFKDASIIYTSRMHTVYMAGLLGVKVIPIRVHPKLEYSARLFDDNLKLLDPLDDVEKYISCLSAKLQFDEAKFLSEYEKVLQLNERLVSWLKGA